MWRGRARTSVRTETSLWGDRTLPLCVQWLGELSTRKKRPASSNLESSFPLCFFLAGFGDGISEGLGIPQC